MVEQRRRLLTIVMLLQEVTHCPNEEANKATLAQVAGIISEELTPAQLETLVVELREQTGLDCES